MSYLPGQFTHIPAVSSSSNITGGVNMSDCVLNYNTLSGNKTVLSAISFFIIVPVYQDCGLNKCPLCFLLKASAESDVWGFSVFGFFSCTVTQAQDIQHISSMSDFTYLNISNQGELFSSTWGLLIQLQAYSPKSALAGRLEKYV